MCQRISTGTPTAVPSTELSGRELGVEAAWIHVQNEELTRGPPELVQYFRF
jgi:type II secretory pathway component HofQ